LGGQSFDSELLDCFRGGLRQGQAQDVAIEYRFAGNDKEKLPALAAELVRDQVKLIVATGGLSAIRAAKQAAPAIPILFLVGVDPVKEGLVASFNRPSGNATGVYVPSFEIIAKRAEMLQAMLPKTGKIGYLQNDDTTGLSPGGLTLLAAEIERTKELGLVLYCARNERELDAAFARMIEDKIDALLVGSDPFLGNQHARIASLAARYALPTGCPRREFAVVGGLMSYGPSFPAAWRLMGSYAASILDGMKPENLPVRILNDLEMVINMRTADALGLTVPPIVHVQADKVIE
jgi:putative ABC transport system substrate-binding protein